MTTRLTARVGAEPGPVGGDAFSLQKLLGHSSLDMTRRYAELARIILTVRSLALSLGGGHAPRRH